MRYRVITTCNFDQWCKYGLRMAKTFVRHWPEDIILRVYAEGFEAPENLRAECVSLQRAAPWLADFKASYNQPVHRGLANGIYNYRFDAIKFAHKIAAIGAAAETVDDGVLIWMDADIVTHAPVTSEWLDELFPEHATLGWLDRSYKEAECGFLMFRMPAAQVLIDRIVEAYKSGSIFRLEETHDSYVIQKTVEKEEKRGEIVVCSLSGDKRTFRHPFVNSRLGECMDHLKGARKAAGKSLDADLKHPRPEPYWQ